MNQIARSILSANSPIIEEAIGTGSFAICDEENRQDVIHRAKILAREFG